MANENSKEKQRFIKPDQIADRLNGDVEIWVCKRVYVAFIALFHNSISIMGSG